MCEYGEIGEFQVKKSAVYFNHVALLSLASPAAPSSKCVYCRRLSEETIGILLY